MQPPKAEAETEGQGQSEQRPGPQEPQQDCEHDQGPGAEEQAGDECLVGLQVEPCPHPFHQPRQRRLDAVSRPLWPRRVEEEEDGADRGEQDQCEH